MASRRASGSNSNNYCKRMKTFVNSMIALLLTWGALHSGVASAQQPAPQPNTPLRSLSVSGEGKVSVEPDEATVRFGVVTRHDDAEEARSRNATASKEAMNAVRALGIPERKIRMETLRLNPYHDYNPSTQRHEELGYEAERAVVVEIDDLEKLPDLVAQVVQKGANRLYGVEYGFSDRSAAINEALEKAVANARQKANVLASSLGVNIGRPLQVSEQSFDFPRPMMHMEMRAVAKDMAQAAPEPEAYAPGEIEVRASIQLVYEIE